MHRFFFSLLLGAAVSISSLVSPLGVVANATAKTKVATEAAREPFLSNIRQMTLVGKRGGEGYFSPNGRMMIFQSEREPGNPFYQMYMMNRDTGDVNRISPGYGKTTCGWIHPLQQKALFASTQDDPRSIDKQKAELKRRKAGPKRRYSWDYDENYDLQEVDFSTGRYTNLTKTRGYDAEASYSPDGRQIVFASNRSAYDHKLSAKDKKLFAHNKSVFMELYIMNADGSNVRRLTKTPGYDGGPFFSADGGKIIWRRFSVDGRSAEIYMMNADGSDQRQITRLGLMSWAPFFHPSGDYFIFSSNRFGHANFELFIMDAKGRGDPVRITNSKGFDGLPVFTPDGKHLSWTSKRGGKGSQIFMANWDEDAAREQLGLDKLPSTNSRQAGQVYKEQISRLSWHVASLASEQMEGRLTGTKGERKAADYVAGVFRLLGLEPAGDKGSYFQSFSFTSGVKLGDKNDLTLSGKDYSMGPILGEQWRPLSFSRTGEQREAPVVFAGFGIEAPKTDKQPGYNSYEDVDVKGKWVLVFRGLPSEIKPALRLHLSRFSQNQYKASVAHARGALGIVFAPAPGVEYKDELIKLTLDAVGGTSSLAAITINNQLMGRLLKPLGNGFPEMITAVDAGAKMRATQIPDMKLSSIINIVQEKKTGRNVLARLRSKDRQNRSPLIVGAHLDHLGRGNVSMSLAKESEKGKIHFGADDNASGVAALLEMAERFSGFAKYGYLKPQRDMIFAAWSGEELGLLGSNHFIKQLKQKSGHKKLTGDVSAYLNMDMVGRYRQKLTLNGIGSSSVWSHIVERANILAQLNLKMANDSYVPSDATSFYLAGIPVLAAFTGSHDDYHRPSDTPDKINYRGLAKTTILMEGVARQLVRSSRSPDYKLQEKPANSGARRRAIVYLGTVPDYAAKGIKGLRLSGVMKNGPAEQAGLQAGDTITSMAKMPIGNIYDYVRVINMLKIGKAVRVSVLRNKSKLEFMLTPAPKE
ncbi:MAG: M28 family peptidase [Hyphomicrobiaceae bacterium]|nr:M28 family peptidase [Hyphomicrobiaceae bacterium]